jgi:hypothetical protein
MFLGLSRKDGIYRHFPRETGFEERNSMASKQGRDIWFT